MVLIAGGGGFVGRTVRRVLPEAAAPSSRELDLTDGGGVVEAIGDLRAYRALTVIAWDRLSAAGVRMRDRDRMPSPSDRHLMKVPEVVRFRRQRIGTSIRSAIHQDRTETRPYLLRRAGPSTPNLTRGHRTGFQRVLRRDATCPGK